VWCAPKHIKVPHTFTQRKVSPLTPTLPHGQLHPVNIPAATKYSYPFTQLASSLVGICGCGGIGKRTFRLGNRWRWWSASRCGHFTASNSRRSGSRNRSGRSENDSHTKSNPYPRLYSLWPSHYIDWPIASPAEAKHHANSGLWKHQLKSGATTFPPVRDNGRHSHFKAGVSLLVCNLALPDTVS
jgi:hypothetical protein